jgi:hypothetical protein
MEFLTVKDIIENFLENIEVKLVKNEEYEKVMGYYEKIVAIPEFEYTQLLLAQKELDKRMGN